MLTTPAYSAEDARANAAFQALMRAFARPGTLHELPEPGEGPIIAALIDRESRVFAADPLLMPALLEAGAAIAELPEADHVFAGRLRDVEDLAGIAVGSDLYPDEGATLVIRAKIDSGPSLRLTGPGIDGEATIAIDGLPEGFWRLREGAARYPMGFDICFVDGIRLLALPRSTQVEVL